MLPRINLIQTDIGQFLVFSTKDYISQHLMWDGTWEPTTLKYTKLLLEGVPEPQILDIGANLGAYTIPVAKMILPLGGTIHSFEAQRIIFQQLGGNIFLNRLDNVTTYNLAVSDQEKPLRIPILDYTKNTNIGALSLSDEVHEGRHETIDHYEQVEAITLDYFASTIKPGFKCSLLKIDVEGMELEVFKGATNLIKSSGHPPILFEVWSGKGSDWYKEKKEKTLQYLKDLGYEYILSGDMGIAQHRECEYFKELS